MNWLPEEVTHMEEFLSNELEHLRNHVLNTRKEDISPQLYVYENRVVFSQNGLKTYLELGKIIQRGNYREIDLYGENNDIIAWESIRSYPYKTENGKEICYNIEKRKVKMCFLMGWLEVRLWDRGQHKIQKVYPPFEKIEDINLPVSSKGQFILKETTQFSMDLMKNYWEIYLNKNHAERRKKPRFLKTEEPVSNGNTWQVFVTSDLRNYYYGEDETIGKSQVKNFFPLQKEMKTINCQRKTETRHAVIANFDSWQAFRHASSQEREDLMSLDRTNSSQIQKLQSEASEENIEIPDDCKKILRKIAAETGTSGLIKTEKEQILKFASTSPKIRLMLRMAQLKFVRSKIAKYIAQGAYNMNDIEIIEKSDSYEARKSKGYRKKFENLILWVSYSWTPQWAGQMVTADEIPEQKHEFKADDGEVLISCYWGPEHDDEPAYIRISWKADAGHDELGIRFENPDTKEILYEDRLGAFKVGEEIFTSKDLGFDPSTQKWSIAILFLEGE
ncbi:Uncharacterized protein dnl_62380 [Desulfonema limicola]|uniref:Uncharacterized protein n=1 Tax=Desulfonema limicola TaxID=45656 RepID=A0A975BE79_9BACT|nr:hypothetical protein [Desulfonema limicola]QTA83821.1 Uncharacterized protein dnl_62380 [Desulfonema limicola]